MNSMQADWLIAEIKNHRISDTSIREKLEELGIHKADIQLLPVDAYLELFEWASRKVDDPCFGLHLGRDLDIRTFGIFGYLCQNATTIDNLFDLIEKYQPILMQGMGYLFKRSRHACEILPFYSQPGLTRIRQDTDFSISVVNSFLRQYAGPEWYPERVNFTFDAEPFIDEYRAIFGDEVYFNQPYNSLVIGSTVTHIRVTKGDPQLLRLLQQQANKLLEESESNQHFLQNVRLLITTGISDDKFGAEKLAYQLHMTSRTLRRHLKKHNTTFKKLYDEAMLALASEALLKTRSSISNISQQLGFSEPAAFVRSFKRVTGVSPSQFRKAGLSERS